jgi:hypothetical protein
MKKAPETGPFLLCVVIASAHARNDGAPFLKTVSCPSGKVLQTSSRVNGLDAITATRSFGVVSF